jgi:hypothetical protein
MTKSAADAFMSIFGYRRVRVVDEFACPPTQAVHRAREEAYRKRHAALLDELAAHVGRPLPAVEQMTKG